MAGFRIEYSGGAVQRKDVPQATGNSSLTQTTTSIASPVAWEGGTILSNSAGQGNALPAGYVQEGILFQSTSGGVLSFANEFYIATPYRASFWSAQGIGVVNYEYRVSIASAPFNFGKVNRVRLVKVTDRVAGDVTNIDNLTAVLHDDFIDFIGGTVSAGVFFIRAGTTTVSAGESLRLVFESDDQHAFSLDYFRIFTQSSAPVVITGSTFANGIDATGGSAVTPSVSTYQSGTGAVSTPAKEFGLVLKHNGEVISDTKYLPPAQVSQSATATLHDQGIITATATTITAEGEGLGGSDKLRALDTRVMVEDYKDAVEY